MYDHLLDRPVVRMPEFGAGTWLNTSRLLSRDALRGCVVLVDFWDYACINCVRGLPYLRAWHERYTHHGLVIVGVHAPEFRFGRMTSQIEAAIDEFSLPYPVLLDNDYVTWDSFANRAWPSKHLVDADGYIRFVRRGEGYYRETEQAIQELLHRRNPDFSYMDPLPSLREEDQPGSICYRPTPELHAGFQGGGLFGGALGNPEGYVTAGPMAYVLPGPFDREVGHFYLSGFWRAEPEAMAFAGREIGRVVLPYRAAGVNVVLSPSSDPLELMPDIRPATAIHCVEVRQDDVPLTPLIAGADVYFDEQKRSLLSVTRPRSYELVRNPGFEEHELDLILHSHGLAVYTFSFASCVVPPGTDIDPDETRFVVK